MQGGFSSLGRFHVILFFVALLIPSCSKDGDSEVASEPLITPNAGVGNVTFQDDGNKVMEEYGMYSHLTSVGGGGQTAFVMWYDNGLGFQLDHVETKGLSLQEVVDMSSDLIDLNQQVIQIVIMTPFMAKTKEDVGMGSSRDEVIAVYGEPDKDIASAEDYESLKMRFYYGTSNNVRRIDLYQ